MLTSADTMDMGYLPDPVTLSYAAALRGARPRLPGESFHYAVFGAAHARAMGLLAASNPEGVLWSVGPGAGAALAQENLANLRGLDCPLDDVAERLRTGKLELPLLDYAVLDLSQNEMDVSVLAEVFASITFLLAPGGLLALRYTPFDPDTSADAPLEAVAGRLAVDATTPQARLELLADIDVLGGTRMTNTARVALNKALADKNADAFLARYAASPKAESSTAEIAEGLRGVDLVFLGNADVAANYLELTAPAAMHHVLARLATHPACEIVKDMAMGTPLRCDLWSRQPQMTANPVPRFGGFAFGVVRPVEDIPESLVFPGGRIDLSSDMFRQMIAELAAAPMTIGDYLQHKGISDEEEVKNILSVLQILIAVGVVEPMRAPFSGVLPTDPSWPKLEGPYNIRLRSISGGGMPFPVASIVRGRPILLPGITATILKAVDQGGISEAGARLSQLIEKHGLGTDPSLAALDAGDNEARLTASWRLVERFCNDDLPFLVTYGVLQA
ncbi:MAG: hypothetical protein IPI58_06860 [Alphaproteobacteria bacterium]|nr:MAG: hypothetical protein IPI58_06860 [Alphaproteobacteria bacterium]